LNKIEGFVTNVEGKHDNLRNLFSTQADDSKTELYSLIFTQGLSEVTEHVNKLNNSISEFESFIIETEDIIDSSIGQITSKMEEVVDIIKPIQPVLDVIRAMN